MVLVAAPVIVAFITPGFDAAQTATTVELTRIMLLSPIFLALGLGGDERAQRRRSLRGGGDRTRSTYNLAIIGAALLLAPSMGVDGARDRRRGRVALPPARPAPPAGPPRLPVRAADRPRRPRSRARR